MLANNAQANKIRIGDSMNNKMNNKTNNKKVRKILALTLGLGLAVGSLTGSYTIAQANERPAGIENTQTGHEKLIFDKADHQEILTLLQIDEEAFKKDVDSGMSLTEIAASYHISRRPVVDAVVNNINKQIDKGLADKRITVEQANELKANSVKKAQMIVDIKPIGFDNVNDKQAPQGANDQQASKDGNQNLQEMLTLLKIDAQTFQQEQASGKSLAGIAAAHNVPRQAVVDLVTKDMNKQIDTGLAEKRITAEQAKEMKTNAVQKVQEIVDRSMVEQPAQPATPQK